MERVGALQDDDARVIAQRPVEAAVAGVHGVDAGCAVPQEAIHETAHLAPEVSHDPAAYVQAEGIERRRELGARAGDVRARGLAAGVRGLDPAVAFHHPTLD